MQSDFVRLHLFALNFLDLHAPKAPLPGADSPYQGEMSRRDKRGRDAVSRRLTERLSQIYIKKSNHKFSLRFEKEETGSEEKRLRE